MAELAAIARSAQKQAAPDEDSRGNAIRDRHVDHIVDAEPRPVPVLAHGAGARPVGNADGEAQLRRETPGQGYVGPAQTLGEHDHLAGGIGRSGDGHGEA